MPAGRWRPPRALGWGFWGVFHAPLLLQSPTQGIRPCAVPETMETQKPDSESQSRGGATLRELTSPLPLCSPHLGSWGVNLDPQGLTPTCTPLFLRWKFPLPLQTLFPNVKHDSQRLMCVPSHSYVKPQSPIPQIVLGDKAFNEVIKSL